MHGSFSVWGGAELGEPAQAVKPLEQSPRRCSRRVPLPHQHTFALYYLGAQLLELGSTLTEAEDVLRRAEREALALADPTLMYSIQRRPRRSATQTEATSLAHAPYSRSWVTCRTGRQLACLPPGDPGGDPCRRWRTQEGGSRSLMRRLCSASRAATDASSPTRCDFTATSRCCAAIRTSAMPALETARTIGENSGTPNVVGGAILGLAAAEARWGQTRSRRGAVGQGARPRSHAKKQSDGGGERKLELEPARAASAEAGQRKRSTLLGRGEQHSAIER